MNCEECGRDYGFPFEDVEFEIWKELCFSESTWLCFQCSGLDVLRCDYIEVVKIITPAIQVSLE